MGSAPNICRATYVSGPTGSIAVTCPDRYLIRRAVECATITYDQLTAGVMPAGAARVRRFPATVGQPASAG